MSEFYFFFFWHINEVNTVCHAFFKPEKAQEQNQAVFMIHCEFQAPL